MSITISIPEKPILKPKIVVFGVGGGGCNAVNNMINSDLEGVDFVVANTDAQSLAQNDAERCIQMGAKRTQGLGAGSHPEIGFEAAEEVIGDISDAIHGAHMVFVTAGMGGGTGTGAAPVVARLAKEMGALTVGVVTKPFMFEGNRRMGVAEAGIEEMQKYVDTLLIIPNQNLFRVASEQTALTEAFGMADRVLFSAVAGITNLMVRPGMINLDFADVRTVMGEMGKAMIGTGEAEGEKRGIEAAEHALNNPLLDDVSMKGARGVLISISGNENMKLYEVEEAANRIRSEVDPDAQIIFGATTDPTLDGLLRISVVATGIDQQDQIALPDRQDQGLEEDQPHGDLKSDLKIVGRTNDVPASAMKSRPVADERPRPFQVVPPVDQPPVGAEAEQGLTALAEEQSFSQNVLSGGPSENEGATTASVGHPPPPPLSSAEMDPPRHLSRSGHPFAAPPITTPQVAAPQVAAPQVAAPQVAAPQVAAPQVRQPTSSVHDNPQHHARDNSSNHSPSNLGFFSRLKARLRMTVEEESAARRSAISQPHPAAHSPIAQPQQTDEADTLSDDDDQLEIPNFLKSQAN